jgi:serine/threonine protein kinase
MAEVKSPYVIALKDVTKTHNNYYLALELCNGGDLDNYRKARGGYLKEPEARLILRQILKGIVAIKQKNVMHRDLKLPNIMLHFSEIRTDICLESGFILQDYIKTFEFEKNHCSLTCKIADLGFARKL